MTTPKLDPKILFPAKDKPKPEELSFEEVLHNTMVEVLLILSVHGHDISQESVAFALATRNNMRAKIYSDLTAPFEPTRNSP